MPRGQPDALNDVEVCADEVLRRVGRRVVLGLPLGLGKPNHIVNALYRRAREDSRIELVIATALTLEPPTWDGELERRLVEPLRERLYGGYPELDYARDRRRGELPPNVTVREFYAAPGKILDQPYAQQQYVSSNYTHAARDLMDLGVNVVAQLVSAPEPVDGEPRHSLSCNSDVTLEVVPEMRAADRPTMVVGQLNRELPFMFGDAAVPPSFFDAVLDDAQYEFSLFGVPDDPVSASDHAIGLHAAALVRDGGTLQLGIGSLGNAVTYALLLRHRGDGRFRSILSEAGALARHGTLIDRVGGVDSFEEGIYGASEMFVPGFLELYRAGILSRAVDDDVVLHAAFFLGPSSFYRALREMPERERRRFHMTGVSFVNQLYGDQERKVRQRRHARFLNSGMKATLLGAVSSDALDDGRVVSGVGGQYNFVAMAHALPDARSIMMIPAVRSNGGEHSSNIVWRYANTTIPRHLRDIVVTEYGIADLRGRSDREAIDAMLSVADARFQERLVAEARGAGKLPSDYRIPDAYRQNTPQRVRHLVESGPEKDLFPRFPFGTDLTDEELTLAGALRGLQQAVAKDKRSLAGAHELGVAIKPPPEARPYLERMQLADPKGMQERLLQRAVLYALARAGAI